MRTFLICCLICLTCLVISPLYGQTPPPSEFSVTFNLSQISLPGAGKSIAGAETDVILPFTANNQFGMTTLVSSDYNFIGGRYDRNFPQISKFLNNLSPNLNFLNSQVGLTGSLGVVHANTQSHWGERSGVYWRQSISNTWAMGFEAQWVNFPGYAHSTYSIAIGPSIKF